MLMSTTAKGETSQQPLSDALKLRLNQHVKPKTAGLNSRRNIRNQIMNNVVVPNKERLATEVFELDTLLTTS